MSPRPNIDLTPEEQRRYLEEAKTLILCTNDRHGYPHAVAMWFTVVNGAVLMTTYKKSQKVLNIRRDPKVTLLVESGETYDALKGLMMRGRAELVDDVDQCVTVLTRVHQKMGGALVEGIEEAMKDRARKRILIKVIPQRASSWDHSKLGSGY